MSKRVRGQSLEERVWLWMFRQPGPVKLATVREQFNLDKPAASHVMRRLTWKKSAVRTGVTHTVQYTPTGVRPDDMRGTALATLRILQQHTKARTKRHHGRNRPANWR